jgi:FkbM family methyltransferase
VSTRPNPTLATRPNPTLAKLRPAKVRSALGRRWFEWRMGRTPVSGRGEPVALGTSYGGWMAPAALIEPGWICYSVGAGADISFDLALLARFDVRVQSIEPVEQYVHAALATAAGEPRFAAHRAAIATTDGPVLMQHTHNPGGLALSSANLFDTHEFVEVPGRTLASVARELGHPRIDLLKLDVEGGEYAVIPHLDLAALQIKVLAVQLHHNRGLRAARRLIAHLDERGFEPVAIKPAVKLTFVRRDLLDT